MSEDTKTELKFPKAYVRPTLKRYLSQGYSEENYEKSMAEYESALSVAYTSGALTDEAYEAEVAARAEDDLEDEMVDADGDGLPDLLHVRSQVRAVGNRTQRARNPTRHRFKQYLFADPSKRLVRKRPLRVSAELVRANLDELIEKERVGILSVHAPNGARIDLAALKAGRVVMSAVAPTPPMPNPPLDSAANDTPAGEAMPQYLDGTFVNDPAADDAVDAMKAEKEAEIAKKESPGSGEASTEGSGDFVDPADPAKPAATPAPDAAATTTPVVPTELEQPPVGVDGNLTPIQPAPDTNTETSTETPTAPAFKGEAEEQQDPALADTDTEAEAVEPPKDEPAKTGSSSSSKGGSSKSHKKGSHR